MLLMSYMTCRALANLDGAVTPHDRSRSAPGAELAQHDHVNAVWDLFEVHVLVLMDIVALKVIRGSH